MPVSVMPSVASLHLTPQLVNKVWVRCLHLLCQALSAERGYGNSKGKLELF